VANITGSFSVKTADYSENTSVAHINSPDRKKTGHVTYNQGEKGAEYYFTISVLRTIYIGLKPSSPVLYIFCACHCQWSLFC